MVGKKDVSEGFLMAACELAGQVLIYNEDKLQTITEEEIREKQVETVQEVFDQCLGDVKELLLEH